MRLTRRPLSAMLEVTDSAVVMISLLLFFDSENLLPVFLIAAALHELGHLAALRLCGGKLRRLRLSAVGGRMDCVMPEDRARCFFIHFAGAAMNFAAFALFRLLDLPLLAGANFVLSIFNLLPVCPLDGYACIEALSGERLPHAAEWLGTGFTILRSLFGIWIFYVGNGLSLAVIGLSLTVFSCKNLQKN